MQASAPKADRVGAVQPQPTRDPAQNNLDDTPPHHKTRLTLKLARFFLSVSVVVVASVLTLLLGEVFVRFFAPTERLVPLNEVILGITAQRPNITGVHSLPQSFDVPYSPN